MLHTKSFKLSILSGIILISLLFPFQMETVKASSTIPFIILSKYKLIADIGDELHLSAITSNGKSATWKSNDSRIAAVNTYGKVTAKKAGTAIITAKIKNAEASCQITVKQTEIILDTANAVIEHGKSIKISASTSNKHKVTWKSSRKSVAVIDDNGLVTGIKPGRTTITAKADTSVASCVITVKSPIVSINKTTLQLYRGQTETLSATISSNVNPTWKSSKKSVAIVDEYGTVTALKNGVATITVTADGIFKTCQVIVLKPEIILSCTELYLKPGVSTTISASVSSNHSPVWTSSNQSIASVDSNGNITAVRKGTAYIYACEDGTKVRCKIQVTE